MKNPDSTISAPPLLVNLSKKDIARFWSKVDKNGPTQPHMESQCWVWKSNKCKGGYGLFKLVGKTTKTHRIAWIIANGPIPNNGSFHGICVCHRCDRRDCCRPDHFFLGAQKDNIRDMESKGRGNHPRGDKNGSRLHPESRPRGDNHHARLRPENLARGDRHGSRTKPECVPRGDANGSRRHPERVPRGVSNGNAKLTDAIVIGIRARYAAGGVTLKSLAAEFCVSFGLIGHIINRRAWKHIQ